MESKHGKDRRSWPLNQWRKRFETAVGPQLSFLGRQPIRERAETAKRNLPPTSLSFSDASGLKPFSLFLPPSPSRNAPKPPWYSYDPSAHIRILGNQAYFRIVTLHFAFLLGRLRAAQSISFEIHLAFLAVQSPACEGGLVREHFNAPEHDLYTITGQ